MTHRERWLRTLRFEKVDRGVDVEFGAWEQTVARWHKEGMPKREGDGVWNCITRNFHTDDESFGPSPWLHIGLSPGWEYKVLEVKGDHRIVQDGDGAVSEMLRPELGASIPRYLRHAIETRQDWEKVRDERLDPSRSDRVPKDLDVLCKKSHDAEYPVTIWCGSLYGWIRNWMGVENLSLAVYDDPAWVEEMMEHLTRLTLSLFEKMAGKAKIDIGNWWEDMCYNHGSLLSPKHFGRLMVPRYKRITDFLRRECGCEFNCLDCDGNIHELVPLWFEGGINVMFPVEALHTDGYRIRRAAADFGIPLINDAELARLFIRTLLRHPRQSLDAKPLSAYAGRARPSGPGSARG
jgi:uroporphyrinogen decarboxylase